MTNFTTIYSMEELPEVNDNGVIPNSFFLAGPFNAHQNWRDQVPEILDNLSFDGIMLTPDGRDNAWNEDNFKKASLWNIEAIQKAEHVAFWVETVKGVALGTTTRFELGKVLGALIVKSACMKDNKLDKNMTVGIPKGAWKVGDLHIEMENAGVTVYDSLEKVLCVVTHKLMSGMR